MPLAKPLPDVRRELEQQLAEGNEYLPAILKQLQSLLPEGSEKRNTAIVLMGRLNDANKKALRQTISDNDLQVEYNAIRADLLDFIAGLTEADFDATTAAKAGPDGEPAPKQGNVLYRIPRTMPMLKETECVVRIAISEDAIVENITLDKSVSLKDLKRVSDVMQVELADPGKEPVFNIRTTSEAQQLITDEGYTEWFFYVEPTRAGVFPIEIKVAVLEMALNNVYRKEIVFRETVEIITEGTPLPEDGGGEFKAAGAVLNFQGGTTTGGSVPAMGEGADAPPKTERSALSKAGGFLAVVAIAAIMGIFLTPPELRDWLVVDNFKKTAEAYTKHTEEYPRGPHREEATYRAAVLTDTPGAYHKYQLEYPRGKYRKEVEAALKVLENKRLQEIRQNPDTPKIIGFINDFPDNDRLPELMQIAQSKPELKRDLWPEFENILFDALRKTPTAPAIRTLLKTFPETNRLPELMRILDNQPGVKKMVGPDIEIAWLGALRKKPEVPSIRAFLAEFPDSERLGELKQVVDSTQQWKPEDKLAVLAEIETIGLQSIQRNPFATKIRSWLTLFPESQRLPDLKHLVDTIPELKQEVMPDLEKVYWQSLLKDPAEPRIRAFLREFPELDNIRLLELRKIVEKEKNRKVKQDLLKEIKNRIAALQPKRPSVNISKAPTQPVPGTTATQPGTPPPGTPPLPPGTTPPPTTNLPKPPKPKMTRVKPGTFTLGCTDEQGSGCAEKSDEKLVFDIKVGGFYIGKYEVTFEEYDLFCAHTGYPQADDNNWGRDNRPVINVSWFDAVNYCNWLSQQHGLSPAYSISGETASLNPAANGYRLPTEAEWEYAARGGDAYSMTKYAGSDNLDEVAWHQYNSGKKTHPVGTRKANELGLEDMSGNVLEWCGDWFGPYPGEGANNPSGPGSGEERVVRSSSWISYTNTYYIAARRHSPPDTKTNYLGFRLARG